MKLTFQTGRSYRANKIELGDKHDQSVVHLLSTLPGEVFLVEIKGGSWIVTTGLISMPPPTDPVIVEEEFTPTFSDEKPKAAKPKAAKPKKKKR